MIIIALLNEKWNKVLTSRKKYSRSDPSNSPFNMQQFRKPVTGVGRAGIVAIGLFDAFLAPVYDAIAWNEEAVRRFTV